MPASHCGSWFSVAGSPLKAKVEGVPNECSGPADNTRKLHAENCAVSMAEFELFQVPMVLASPSPLGHGPHQPDRSAGSGPAEGWMSCRAMEIGSPSLAKRRGKWRRSSPQPEEAQQRGSFRSAFQEANSGTDNGDMVQVMSRQLASSCKTERCLRNRDCRVLWSRMCTTRG